MVDVVGNTSTSASSSESSRRPDVPDAPDVLDVSDVPNVLDVPKVAEPGGHDLIEKDDDVLREIMSMSERRRGDKTPMLLT